MRKLWLIFAQTATIALALYFVMQALRPDLLRSGANTVVNIQEVAPGTNTAKLTSLSAAAKRAMPSVVNIFTSKKVSNPQHPFANDPVFRYFFGERFSATRRVSSLGSGVIVSPEGYILTNHHVVGSADEVKVAFADGRSVDARIIGTDPESDLAVIRIAGNNFSPIVFGRSEEAQVGDVVLAIGNPFGVGQTLTMGIVSALERSHLGINTFENFIQTDAAINPGNSGGALVDSEGQLIGINTAIFSPSGGSLGIGFAIPVSLAKQVMEQIIRTGSVTRGWIGVEGQDITPDLAESFRLPNRKGALIAGVLPGGPADRAGIRPGDILVAINNNAVADSTAMLNQISSITPGNSVSLRLLRGGSEIVTNVQISKRPKSAQRTEETVEIH